MTLTHKVSSLESTIFIAHVRILRNGSYANGDFFLYHAEPYAKRL